MEIRPVRPEELAEVGRITLEAYRALPGYFAEEDYEAELGDPTHRAEVALVLVAVEDDQVLGGVTFVPDVDNPMAEHDVADAASMRMLAVSADAQGRGVGQALVEACLDQARAAGASELLLHSTQWMSGAHRLYQRLGFHRDPTLDWTPVEGVDLLCFRRALGPI